MFAVSALIGLMVLTWGAAIWASFHEGAGKEPRATRVSLKKAA